MLPPILTAALVAFWALAASPVHARMQFLSPPAFDGTGTATTRPVRTLGTALELKWTPAPQGKKLSVVLYQLNATRAAGFDGVFHYTEGPFEFITHDQVDATSFTWIVGTTKDLSDSPYFSIAVWVEGALDTDSATDVFTIAAAGRTTSSSTATTSTTSSSSSSSSSSRAPTSASTTVSTISSQTGTSTTPSGSSTDSASSGSSTDSASSGSSTDSASAPTTQGTGRLSTGAVVGVAVGTSSGVLLLAAAGWWLRRRHLNARRQQGGGTTSVVAEVSGGHPQEHFGLKQEQSQAYYSEAPLSVTGELDSQDGRFGAHEVPGENYRHELM